MNSKWPLVSLGEVVDYRKEFIQVDDTENYKLCRVQTNAKGVVLRSVLAGVDIKTKRQQVCRAGDFLVAEIDAKAGGYGLVPLELDGAVVSSHYFLYEANESKVLRGYLDFMSRTPQFGEQVKAQGSTNYAAIRPQEVLGYKMPLPPLLEQERLVKQLEQVQRTVTEIKRLRAEQQDELRLLLRQQFRLAIADAPREPLGKVAPLVRRPVAVDEELTYHELGIRSFGKGTFHKPGLPGLEVGTKKLYHIHPGDLLFSNVFAWEGAIAVAQPADEGRVGSHRFISCLCDEEQALPEFLRYYFLTPEGMKQINAASPGGAGRNKTLGLEKLERIQVPVPPLAAQRTFLALQARLTQLTTTQHAAQAELDLLLPAALDKAFRGEL